MKLVTFTTGGQPAVGVVDDEAQQVRDVTALLPPGTGVLELIEGWAQWGPLLADKAPALPATALEDVRLSAPIPAPRRGQLLDQGPFGGQLRPRPQGAALCTLNQQLS